MVRHIFVVNLDSSKDRMKYYQHEKFTRWRATHWKDLDEDHPIFKKMISYHNVQSSQHGGKCGCYLSHQKLYQHIIDNSLHDVLIIEDDAMLVNPIPKDLPQDGFTYLGGFTSHTKMTDGPLRIDFEDGIHKIEHSEYRVLMTLAIYIPSPSVAKKMLNSLESETGRIRAIDVMLRDTHLNQYISYPASFIERPEESQIRKNKNKFSNDKYHWVTANQLMNQYPKIFIQEH
jgi:hypothetical protein